MAQRVRSPVLRSLSGAGLIPSPVPWLKDLAWLQLWLWVQSLAQKLPCAPPEGNNTVGAVEPEVSNSRRKQKEPSNRKLIKKKPTLNLGSRERYKIKLQSFQNS